MKNFLLYILICIPVITGAQSSYNIQLFDEKIEIQENINSFEWNQMPETSKFKNGYFGWVQFFETPKLEVQNEFKAMGLELIEYLPNKAYVFYFPSSTSIQYLKDKGVRAITPINGQYKLTTELRHSVIPEYALDGDNIMVMLQYHKQTNSANVIEKLTKHGVRVIQDYKSHHVLALSIPMNTVETLSNMSFVKWIEFISPPEEKFDNQARGLQRSSNLDTQTQTGRNYTGEGIGVLVRDFGSIGPVPHIDFQGRLTELNSDVISEDHGDGVAGVMAGAGNLNPTNRGMAAGSAVYNVDRNQHFMDAETTSLITSGAVQITNTSSGLQCLNTYAINAVNVDQQVKDFPTILHVLAAGNSNPFDCGYGAGGAWANLGGANKIAKNIIAAGNTNFDGSIASSSSRGPAADGRIKPDLTAMGDGQVSTGENNQYIDFGGTSAASPTIAGVAAQLYQAYGDSNDGELPQSALIKAAMLNTANEAGNIGPDFIYGWGIVNGLRAARIIEEGQYMSDEIAQGNTNNHVISVPSGAAQVKIMVYWSDVPGTLGANPALVNDLDLVVNDPSSNSLLPWILDATPTPAALNSPATNGEDHLNNMEQVQIDNPSAGDYTLDVTGFNVPMGSQEYFVVYEITMDNIDVTYPDGGESFVPGTSEVIHWDAINTTEDFTIDYSLDNGSSWTNIASVSSSNTLYVWNVPSTLVGSAIVRVSSGTFTDTSDSSFSLAHQVEGFAFSQVCPDGTTFTWDALEGAESYDIYILGEKFMEVVGNSTSTSITVPVADPTMDIWAAITAKNETENWTSLRTIAIVNEGGFSDCSLSNDISIDGILNDPNGLSTPCADSEGIVVSVAVSNMGSDDQSDFELSYQLNNGSIVTEVFSGTLMSGEEANYDFTTTLTIPGADEYTLVVTANLTDDQNEFNDTGALNFVAAFNGTELDFTEDFEENGITPAGWSIINPDDNITWGELNGIIGIDGNPSKVAFINNWGYNDEGQEDYLVTEYFDLTNATEGVGLSFDLAKAQWNANLHEDLRVEITIDCGESFITIYEKGDLELSTLNGYTAIDAWQPTSGADWRTDIIDLAPFIGESVQFRFVLTNGWGNNTYMDNINIAEGVVGIEEITLIDFSVFPNPATEIVSVRLGNAANSDGSILITNNVGQLISVQKLNGKRSVNIDVSTYSAGLYFITVQSKGISETKKLIVR